VLGQDADHCDELGVGGPGQQTGDAAGMHGAGGRGHYSLRAHTPDTTRSNPPVTTRKKFTVGSLNAPRSMRSTPIEGSITSGIRNFIAVLHSGGGRLYRKIAILARAALRLVLARSPRCTGLRRHLRTREHLQQFPRAAGSMSRSSYGAFLEKGALRS